MPQTHSAGRLFWHKIRLQRTAPLYHRFPTQEYEEPYRTTIGHVLHVPGFKTGIVVGRWWYAVDPSLEQQTLLAAMQGHVEAPDVVGEGGVTVQEHARTATERLRREELERLGWTVL